MVDPSQQVSDVLQYLNPAPEFVTQQEIDSAGDESFASLPDFSRKVQDIEERVSKIEEDLRENDLSKITADLHSSLQAAEERVDVELSRLRVQADHDYSLCVRRVMSLEGKAEIFSAQNGTDSSKLGKASLPARNAIVNLDLDLTSLTTMQRGLYKQIGGALNALVPEKQLKHLQDLRKNLSGQKAGLMKDQQLHVLELLEHQLRG
jgi:archaellum component FlaC